MEQKENIIIREERECEWFETELVRIGEILNLSTFRAVDDKSKG